MTLRMSLYLNVFSLKKKTDEENVNVNVFTSYLKL